MASSSVFTDDYRTLINLLRETRLRTGVTQAQLAAALGEDQSFISKVERRERRLDVAELRILCNALGINLVDLIQSWQERIRVADGPMGPSGERGPLGERGHSGWASETDQSGGRLQEQHPMAESSRSLEGLSATHGQVPSFPALPDRDWTEEDWKNMIEWLVSSGLLKYGQLAALALGHLNPSQVGTSIATKKTFQAHFEPRKCWQAVRQWHFEQSGKCVDCGSRLELQADHVDTRQDHGDAADRLENMVLRCRRCNVIRRPSHKNGGLTFLTAESALMWILFTKRPPTYQQFETLCREYGLSMANIRFEEAWAMAKWLERDGLYTISPHSKH